MPLPETFMHTWSLSRKEYKAKEGGISFVSCEKVVGGLFGYPIGILSILRLSSHIRIVERRNMNSEIYGWAIKLFTIHVYIFSHRE